MGTNEKIWQGFVLGTTSSSINCKSRCR